MISAKLLFDIVNKNLSGFQGGGYSDVGRFNRDLLVAQEILFDFYRRSGTGLDERSLYLFAKSEVVPVSTAGVLTLPEDYREVRSVFVEFLVSDCGTTTAIPTVYKPVTPQQLDQLRLDAILKPNAASQCAYRIFDQGSLAVAPVAQEVTLRYYRSPITPSLVLTYGADDLETEDTAATVNLEWPEAELDNFVTLLTFQKGITDRESALTQYAQLRAQGAGVTL